MNSIGLGANRGKSVAACLLGMLLLVSACSSDGDSESTDSAATAVETPTPDATSTPSAAATETPAATEEATTDPTEENFASFRGVTADTIKVGVAVPDFDALQAAGINAHQGDAEVVFQALFDVVNEAGGIHGREIEPVYASFNFMSPVTQEEACTKLTEDNEVFIVLYGLLADNNLCLTELHDTMVMTDIYQTAEAVERSGDTLWLQTKAADEERTRILAQVVAEAGMLEGRTIGVVAAGVLGSGAEGEIMQETLTELGYDSTLAVTTAPLEDRVAQREEFLAIAERFKAEGIDFVFEVAASGAVSAFSSVGYNPQVASSLDLANVVSLVDDRAPFDGAVGVADRPERVLLEDPVFRQNCIDPIIAANPDLEEQLSKRPTDEEQAAGEPNWINPARLACNMVLLLSELGEIAGADLTNESFLAALDELGTIELFGYGQASFRSADKWDGVDEFYLQTYDAATDTVEVVGEPIIVER